MLHLTIQLLWLGRTRFKQECIVETLHTPYRLILCKRTIVGQTMTVMTKVKRTTGKKKPEAKPFRFGFLIHDVSRMRRTLFDEEMKPLGITRSQWWALSALSRRNDGMMQVDLAKLLEVGKVTVGGLIDRLEATGH